LYGVFGNLIVRRFLIKRSSASAPEVPRPYRRNGRARGDALRDRIEPGDMTFR
jgi:hypothetical protein